MGVLGALACGDTAQKRAAPSLVERLLRTHPQASGGAVAARLDGAPIHADEVAARLHKRRAAGDGRATARDVAFDLALEDLAAKEAERQGLTDDESVRHAVRQAMVQALIAKDFDAITAPDRVPEDFLKRSFQKNFSFYNNPEVRGYEHLLVWSLASENDEAKRQRARALAEAFRETAAARAPKALDALAEELKPRAKAAGFDLRHESSATSRTGVEKDFADVLFETEAGAIGARVAESRFGYHVVFCKNVTPSRNQTFTDVRKDVLERSHPTWRQQTFRAWTAQLRAQHHAEIADMAHLLFRGQRRQPPAVPKP